MARNEQAAQELRFANLRALLLSLHNAPGGLAYPTPVHFLDPPLTGQWYMSDADYLAALALDPDIAVDHNVQGISVTSSAFQFGVPRIGLKSDLLISVEEILDLGPPNTRGGSTIWTYTFNYVMGNPVSLIDPTGRNADDFYFDKDGNLVNRVVNDQPDRFFVQNGGTTPVYTPTPTSDGSTMTMTKSFEPTYDQIDMNGDLGHMIRTTYAEAQAENLASKRAVAEVIRNRAQDNTANSAATGYNAIFSNVSTYQDVVSQRGQFSSVQNGVTAYSTPQNLLRPGGVRHAVETAAFVDAVSASIQAHYQGTNTTNGSVYFYSPYISAPSWVPDLTQVAVPGVDTNAFKLYRFP